MEEPNSTLLPYVLEVLNRKQEPSDTVDHLCEDIEKQLQSENNCRYPNVRTALHRALSTGQSLGIIALANGTVRMPFNVRGSNHKNNNKSESETPEKEPSGTTVVENQPAQESIPFLSKNRRRTRPFSKEDNRNYRVVKNRPKRQRTSLKLSHRSRSRKASKSRSYSRRSYGGRSYSRRR